MIFFSTILYFHVKTFKKIKKAINLGLTERFGEKSLIKWKIIIKFSEGIFVSFLCKSIGNIPILIVHAFDTDRSWPTAIHLYAWLFFRLSAALNPIIYPIYHSSFWLGYINVYHRLFFTKKQIKLKKKRALKMIQIRKKRRMYEIRMKNNIDNEIFIKFCN